MVKSTDDGSSSTAPFLKKCYEMVDDGSTDSVISWSTAGDNSFIIWDITEFSVRLLPKFFKHCNFSSFIRQLNIYGFRKVEADRWEFANDGFVRGQKDLLKTISRRKNAQSIEQQRRSCLRQEKNTIDQPENGGLVEQVENLKSDRNVLMQELIKLRQYQETSDGKMLHLNDRVQGMEESQQQMLSFLVMVMQNPNLLVQLLQPQENNSWRVSEAAATILEEVTEEGESLPLVTYQPPLEGTAKPVVVCTRDRNESSDSLKDFIRNADMMKACVDENHVPLIIPDLYDDGAWEKLLLLSPSRNGVKNAVRVDEEENKSNGDAAMEYETEKSHRMLELIVKEMEKLDEFEDEGLDPEKSRDLEFLTEQMEVLASEE